MEAAYSASPGALLSMWTDNETDLDYLNFSGVAETVAELIVQANARPISIGIVGAWGVGKSSMIRLVQAQLEKRQSEKNSFVFVTFNAWLYQGYDDARAALMDVIGDALQREAEKRKTGIDKTKAFLKRVRWTRVVKLGAAIAATAAGFPPIALAENRARCRKVRPRRQRRFWGRQTARRSRAQGRRGRWWLPRSEVRVLPSSGD